MTMLWQPSEARKSGSNMTRFMKLIAERHSFAGADYPALHAWSIKETEKFWDAVWDFTGVIGDKGGRIVKDKEKMPGARFFPEGKLNFAQTLLRKNDETPALIFRGEDKVRRTVTWRELNETVSRLQQALLALDLKPGDRVVGFIPNMPEAVMAMLAAASIGATWSSCSPDFGINGVLDRFGQIEPSVLFVADGYFYNGKTLDCLERAKAIVDQLPKLKKLVVIPYTNAAPKLDGLDARATQQRDVARRIRDAADVRAGYVYGGGRPARRRDVCCDDGAAAAAVLRITVKAKHVVARRV